MKNGLEGDYRRREMEVGAGAGKLPGWCSEGNWWLGLKLWRWLREQRGWTWHVDPRLA